MKELDEFRQKYPALAQENEKYAKEPAKNKVTGVDQGPTDQNLDQKGETADKQAIN